MIFSSPSQRVGRGLQRFAGIQGLPRPVGSRDCHVAGKILLPDEAGDDIAMTEEAMAGWRKDMNW